MTCIHRKTVIKTTRESSAPNETVPPYTRSATTTLDMPAAPTWCFNEHLRIIAHEPRSCEICTSWTMHYVEHIMDKASSVHKAERTCDAAIIGNLHNERDTLLAENIALQEQISTLQEEQPRKLSRRDPSPCVSMHAHSDTPPDEDCNTSHPSLAPPRLLQ
jgi:hypothetical protein